MLADLEGRFSGALPREGTWRVEISPAGETDPLTTRVDVSAGPDGVAELDVVIPDTEVFGRTVFADGTVAEGARIGLDVDGENRTARSDEKGEFSIEGVREGTGMVSGSLSRDGRRWSSETAIVSVVEDSPRGPLEIVLRPSREIAGQVVSNGIPVASAIVEARTAEPPTAGFSDRARSDREGRFTLEVHPAATLLSVTIRPPGYALTARYAFAEEPLLLEVSRHGGDLVLVTDAPSEEVERRGLRLWLLAEGQILSWQSLWEWARGHSVIWSTESTAVRTPNLAPGRYEACFVGQQAVVQSQRDTGGWRPAAFGCVEGYLQAGSELVLTMPPLDRAAESRASDEAGTIPTG